MIITCPSCSTSYDIDGAALGAAGKTVRCASCGNKWHQAGAGAPPEPQQAPPHPAPPQSEPPRPAAPPPLPSPSPSAPEETPSPLASETAEESEPGGALDLPTDEELDAALGPERESNLSSIAPEEEEDLTEMGEEDFEDLPDPDPVESFVPGESSESEEEDEDLDPDEIPDPEPIPNILSDPDEDFDDEPKRRLGLWISIAAAIVLLAGIGAGGYFGRNMVAEIWPTSIALYDIAGVEVEFPGKGLKIRPMDPSRETDEDGKEVIVVRGVITNVSDKPRQVPMIEVALLDDIDQRVRSIRVPPLKSSLEPNEEMGFRARLDDVPTARKLEVTFADGDRASGDGESEMPTADK
jgi:predicted Zn finger-like uncharacterized protein